MVNLNSQSKNSLTGLLNKMIILPMSRSASGMTLVAVLIAVSILGVVAATLVTLFGNMSGMVMRSNAQADADNLIRYISGVLGQPGVCDTALQTAASLPVTWNYANPDADVYKIVVGGNTAVQIGQQITPAISVRTIKIQKFSPAEVAIPIQRQVGAAYPTFSSMRSKLVFSFQSDRAQSGGEFNDRTLELVVATDAANNIVYCYQPKMTQAIDRPCAAIGDLYDSAFACGALPGGAGCEELYYIAGFDTLALPICKCRISCTGGASAASPVGAY